MRFSFVSPGENVEDLIMRASRNAKVKDANIQLLRIIAMVGVNVMHYNGFSGHAAELTDSPLNYYFCVAMNSFFVCATNVFMLISGYYLAGKRTVSFDKVIILFLQNTFMWLCTGFLNLLMGEGFSLKRYLTSTSYFIILYCCTYVLSPFINILLDSLTDKGRLTLIAVLFGVFSIYPYLIEIVSLLADVNMANWSPVGAEGNQSGYTITIFLLMYVIGAVIRKNEYSQNIRVSGALYLLFAGIIFFHMYLRSKLGFQTVLHGYFNPFVILCAVELFAFFRTIKITRGGVARMINFFARGTIAALIMHGFFVQFLDIEHAARGSIVYLALHMLGSSFALYILSLPFYIAFRHLLEIPIGEMLGKLKIEV